MLASLTSDSQRLSQQLEQLASYSSAPAPAVTRILYSPEDMQARAYLKHLMAEAGLEQREDALGNLYARWPGSDESLAAVATGSHTDAIPFSGRYDGTVGVLGALEAFRSLRKAGFQPRRSLELIMFTSEEPTRFGVGCLGSRAMAGILTPEAIRALRDDEGQSPDDLRKQLGFSGDLTSVRLPTGHYHYFVELHIEQGPLLEQESIPIGIVTAIAAPATLQITLKGEGGHAGAMLMPQRRDALVAAAEITQAVETAALTTSSQDSVATVGILDVHPRAVNSIPSEVFMTVDVRDTDLARRDSMVTNIQQAVQGISQRRHIDARLEILNADPPASCNKHIIQAIAQAAEQQGYQSQRIVSRAYHDALFMARICPISMIFIPCKDGMSHRPDEYASPADIRKGVEVLAQTLAILSHA